MAKKRFYAVAVGRQPGIYGAWQGPGGAQAEVDGYQGARYRGFPTRDEAVAWLRQETGAAEPEGAGSARGEPLADADPRDVVLAQAGSEGVRIYTDGGCIGNPGPGGYGVVVLEGHQRAELSGGYRRTTNNRMELMACIVGLRAYRGPGPVRLFSDSRYVVRAMTEGWAARWRAHAWWRNKREKAENSDLWSYLLDLTDRVKVEFVWVRGHSGHPLNERCDRLAMQAARRPNLPPDEGYESSTASTPEQLSFA